MQFNNLKYKEEFKLNYIQFEERNPNDIVRGYACSWNYYYS